MLDRLLEALLRRRWVVLIVAVALTCGAAALASQVGYDDRMEVWFLDDDPDLRSYRAFIERFEADEVTVIGVFAQDVFAPAVLRRIARITAAAAKAPHAHRVRSLTNVELVRPTDGGVEVGPLMRDLPSSTEQARRLRTEALASRLLSGTLVAPDGKAAAILVELSGGHADFTSRVEHVAALRAILTRERGRARAEGAALDACLAGSSPLNEAFYRYTSRDFGLFGPLTVVLVILGILVVFRRPAAVLVPLAVVGVSVVWIFGVMGLLGLKITMVSTILPTLILAVGVADTIHIIADVYQAQGRGLDRDEAIRSGVRALLAPCFFSSATTAAGLLALLSSELQPIREFGWLAALAVGFAFALSVVLGPVLLSFSRPAGEAFTRRQREGRLTRALDWLGRPRPRASRALLGLTALAVVLSAWGLTRLTVGVNGMEYFRSDDPVRRSIERVDRSLGGSVALELVVRAPGRGLRDPVVLATMARVQTWFEGLPSVTKTVSVADWLGELSRVLLDTRAPRSVPTTRQGVAQLYLLLEGEDELERLVQDNDSIGRISARTRLSEAHVLAGRIDAIDAKMASMTAGKGLEIRGTGFVKLMSKMEGYLLKSQITSFLIAFVVVTLMLALLLRSLRLALFALIPNFAPILIGLAAMAALGIALTPGTVMIGCIALGLVVDDTVHFMVRLRRELRAGHDLDEAVARTTTMAGRPIVVTSLVLAAGFLVLLLASFAPNVHFGLVTALVVLLALAADLVLLPAALRVLRPRL